LGEFKPLNLGRYNRKRVIDVECFFMFGNCRLDQNWPRLPKKISMLLGQEWTLHPQFNNGCRHTV